MAAYERGLNMTGKPVFLLLNGDCYVRKRVVVNRREMPNFECFLDEAGSRFRMPAREIRTPGGRHRIRNLDDLQRDCSYVVVGREPFKKIEYEGKEIKPPRFGTVKLPEINFLQVNHRKYASIQGRAQISGLRKKEETKTIIVFCNGVVTKPKRVQLKTDFKMFQVLEAVNDKVSHLSKYGAVYDLATTDGRHRISEPSQLEDNGLYVAIGRERLFDRSVPYDDLGIVTQLTPRRAGTRPKAKKRRNLAKRSPEKKSLLTDDSLASEIARAAVMASRDVHGSGTPESQILVEPVQQSERLESSRDEGLIPDRIEEPLMSFADSLGQNFGEEKQTEDTSLTENIQDVLGDRGVPLGQLIDDKQDNAEADGRSSRGRQSRNEEDQNESYEGRRASQGRLSRNEEDQNKTYEGGRASQGRSSRNEEDQNETYEVKPSVYQASGEDREDAREIQDDKGTNEDKPIDHVAAEEVAEEEIDENSAENRMDEDRISNKEEEEQPNYEIKQRNSELAPPKGRETSEPDQ